MCNGLQRRKDYRNSADNRNVYRHPSCCRKPNATWYYQLLKNWKLPKWCKVTVLLDFTWSYFRKRALQWISIDENWIVADFRWTWLMQKDKVVGFLVVWLKYLPRRDDWQVCRGLQHVSSLCYNVMYRRWLRWRFLLLTLKWTWVIFGVSGGNGRSSTVLWCLMYTLQEFH